MHEVSIETSLEDSFHLDGELWYNDRVQVSDHAIRTQTYHSHLPKTCLLAQMLLISRSCDSERPGHGVLYSLYYSGYLTVLINLRIYVLWDHTLYHSIDPRGPEPCVPF
ncbi:hypothetical protein KIN20_005841 [Parelaphostrongylus tenuis]|uniref:Uncharacterized protein n=1 Tax=Parelaphostrongylus tenuis TaxID=148309 RepID=A0AAD5M3V9_PARTN|nr:hypothetical protein KIN20_005841 [Parelaphostrongylus tenuis]